jgi:hypothetical protein
MAHELSLPQVFEQRRWKVKIRDRERVEPPHVTVLARSKAWRLNLRTGEWMDTSPDPSEVPEELCNFIWSRRDELREAWDEMYPENPVSSAEEACDD